MTPSRVTQDDSLFSTKKSVFIFWSYISLFVNQGLLAIAVEKSGIYGFNIPIIVLAAEIVKLIICAVIYLSRSQGGGWAALLHDLKSNQKLVLLYMIPAILYCLYNNLSFVNMRLFDASTYYCLMQFRIVLTAIIYQVLFRRQLNLLQWTSLIILTTGCLIKQYGVIMQDSINRKDDKRIGNSSESLNSLDITTRNGEKSKPPVDFLWSISLLFFQMFCSCFAGVYNEYLLKDSSTAKNADVILQNIFMYADSIVCNLVVFVLTSHRDIPSDIGVGTVLSNILSSRLAIILILNTAFSGLVASLFLKNLNSILKTFASALELFAITYLAWLIFDQKVDSHTIIALTLVSLATIIYSKNPVSVAPPSLTPQANDRDGFVRVPMNDD